MWFPCTCSDNLCRRACRYFGQLFPGEHGRKQKPWFFLLPSYWDSCARAAAGDESPIVRTTGLVKTFGKFTAVAGLDVEMRTGQTYCLLGHNGAGKTTAIRMITGHLCPTSGDVFAAGFSVNKSVDRVRAMMGVCPQHDVIWEDLTAREHLETCALMKGAPRALLPGIVAARLDDVKLESVAEKCAGTFSGGMKRRLSVAMSIVGGPKFLILDEPTTVRGSYSCHVGW